MTTAPTPPGCSARDTTQRPTDTADKIQRETLELECRIAETRSDSVLHVGMTDVPVADNDHESVPGDEPREERG